MHAKKENKSREFIEILILLVFLASLTYLLFGFVFRISNVYGESMYPTLHHGAALLLRGAGYTPKRGDIVVFRSDNYGEALVKRVVALGGESVFVDAASGDVYINGQFLEEDYIEKEPLNKGTGRVVNVPEGYIFVLGDNRNFSSDSRTFGPVPVEDITGGVIYIIENHDFTQGTAFYSQATFNIHSAIGMAAAAVFAIGILAVLTSGAYFIVYLVGKKKERIEDIRGFGLLGLGCLAVSVIVHFI